MTTNPVKNIREQRLATPASRLLHIAADLMAAKGIDAYYVEAVREAAVREEKVAIVKIAPRMAAGQKRNKTMKAARLAKKWAEKGAKP